MLISVPAELAGERLDRFLHSQLPQYSRGQLQKLIESGRVRVGEIPAKPSRKVSEGEAVDIELPPADQELAAQAQPLDVLYEDADLLAVNKPAGMVTHPNSFEERGTLAQALVALRPEIRQAVYDPSLELSRLRPGIVHRLDKDTSGVIVAAKSREALLALAQQFHDHSAKKEYVALVYGRLAEPRTVHTAIRRKAGRDNVMGVSLDFDEGRDAVTHFQPEKSFETADGQWLTLVRCRIETGRTHQIRVHAKYIGHAVLGDTLYTNKSATALSQKLGLCRQMLHAASLEVTSPSTGKMVRVEAPLPADFREALTKVRL